MDNGYQPTGDQVVDPKPPSGGSAIAASGNKMVEPIIPPKAQAALRIIEAVGPNLAAKNGVARGEPSSEQLTYATALLTVRCYLESSGPDFCSSLSVPNLNMGIEHADGSLREPKTDAEFLDSLRERGISYSIEGLSSGTHANLFGNQPTTDHQSVDNFAKAVQWLREKIDEVSV